MKSRITGLTRRGLLGSAALATAGVLVGAGQARAEWPERTIKIIVPFVPGGGADVAARSVQPLLQQALGQAVIIENRGGAAGNIGIAAAAKSDADGYTFLLTSSVFTSNPATAKQHFYDPIKDFEPIISFGGSPNLIAANPKLGINNLKDLIAYAKANPGKLNYSTPGVGTPSQLGIELLSLQTGTKFQHVPYAGGNPAVQAAVAGDVQLTVVNIASLISLVRGGQLVGIAQTAAKRWHDLPDVGTQQDAGITGADYDVYYSVLAPAGTPKPVVARMAKELDAIAKREDIRAKLLTAGIDTATGGDAEFLRAKIAKEVQMWKDVVQKADIKVN